MVLADLPAYPSWNPFIRKAEGAVHKGARWHLELTLDDQVFFPVSVVIAQCAPSERLVWRGGLPGLMTGLHGFLLSKTAEGVIVTQSESFAGLIAPAVLPLLRASLQRRFTEMNDALRKEVLRRG